MLALPLPKVPAPLKCLQHRLTGLALATLLLGGIILGANPNYRWNPDKAESPYGSDFLQDWTGANMIIAGEAGKLFDAPTFEAWQHDPARIGFRWDADAFYPTVYPPPYYLLISPIGWISYRVAVVLWLGVLLGSFLAAAALMEKTHGARSAERCEKWFWPAMLLFPPLLLSLTMGQKGAIWLLIWAATWSLLQNKRPLAAGMVFGLLSLKPTLFFLLPLIMLYYRQWRFVSGASLSFGGIWLVAACLLPHHVWPEFLEVASKAGHYHQNAGYQLYWSCNLLSLASGLESSWLPGWIVSVLLAVLAGFVVSRLFTLGRFEAADSTGNEASQAGRYLASVLLATCLLSPHFYVYDLVILLLPTRILWSGHRLQAVLLLGLVWGGMLASQLCVDTVGLPLMPVILLGAFYLLSTVTPGQSSVRNGVRGRLAPSNMLQTGLSPQA